MKPPINVLISEPSHFRVTQIEPELEIMQKLVDGYIEAVTDPIARRWTLYCNEEGKLNGLPVNALSTRFIDELFLAGGGQRFSAHDVLVGTIVWCGPPNASGNDTSLPIELVKRFAQNEITALTEGIDPTTTVISVIRDGDDIFVYDQLDNRISRKVDELARAAREREQHGTIEVWTGISPGRWTELRVEIMDDFRITLHDERDDRSYG